MLTWTSPQQDLEAILDSQHEVVYFYLQDLRDESMKAVWVRNLTEPPEGDPQERMEKGLPPLQPSGGVGPPLLEEEVEVVWFEEGTGAALLERGEILAVIPPWSGMRGFHGYARDCATAELGVFPLGSEAENAIYARVRKAKEWWDCWRQGNPWQELGEALLASYQVIGEHTQYFAIDGGNWPPKAIVRVPVESGTALLTMGVALRPQPGTELSVENPESLHRIELGVCLPPDCDDEFVRKVGAQLSSLANIPWRHRTWLGDHHTVGFDFGSPFSAALLCKKPPGAPALELPTFRDDPINLLWLIPLTEEERQAAIDQGAGSLTERLWEHGVDCFFRPDRPPL